MKKMNLIEKLKKKIDWLMGVWYEEEIEVLPERKSAIPKTLDKYVNPYGSTPREFKNRYEGEF